MNKLFLVALLFFGFSSNVTHAQGNKTGIKKKVSNDIVTKSLMAALDKYYVLSDKALEMNKMLKLQLGKGRYSTFQNPDELAAGFEKDLKLVYPDKHLQVYYDPDFERNMSVSKTDAARKQELDEEMAYDRVRNFMFSSARILPRNIGYVQLNGFSDHLAQAEPTATAAFGFLAHTDAIIVDLRYNGGGNPRMVAQVESYFFKDRTHMSDIQDRSTNKIENFYADPEKSKGVSLAMPVYILTSKRTFSAGEDFSYSMQQVKRAQLVGDTTAGGAHPTRSYALGAGLVAEIPYARSVNPYSKTNWEGTGVLPDYPIASSRALDKALELIYLRELEKSVKDKDKRSIQWQINALKISTDHTVEQALLEKYCGDYEGGLKMYLKNGNFYCVNAERGNDVYKLISLTDTLFTLDENAQIEFLEEGGKFSKLRMHFIDGNARDKKKLPQP